MGVAEAGFKTTVLPAAKAGAILWVARLNGKLKGLIAQTTPIGTLSVYANLFSDPGTASTGITSPVIRLASSAALRKT